MSDIQRRFGRAVRDHGSFERRDERTAESVTTPFEGTVEVAPGEDGRLRFEVTVRVPTLAAVTAEHVAEAVADGWFETFRRRVVDVGGVTARERDLEPTVTRGPREVVVEMAFADVDERRGLDDAGALVDFVEGTYVQGIIPGYEYTEPVTDILASARTGDGAPGPEAGG